MSGSLSIILDTIIEYINQSDDSSQ